MDRVAKGVTASLQARLSLWLSLFVLAAGTLAGALSFWLAFDEAHELQDEQLRQIARLALNDRLSPAPVVPKDGADIDPDTQVRIVQVSGPPRVDDAAPYVPSAIVDGMHTLYSRDKTWRVFVISGSPGARIAAAQTTSVRNEAALDSALRTLLPMIGLIPLLLIVIRVVVRSNLSQVVQLAKMLDKRSEDNLSPLPEATVLEEIHPFVAAINRLLARLDRSIDQQRRFIADAAHELRTPLTALSLQAQNLEHADSLAEVPRRLAPLKQGLERVRHLVEQLLSLARQTAAFPVEIKPVSLDSVVRRVFEEMFPLAEGIGVDLGMERAETLQMEGDEFALYTLLRNVVDNAVRYTPAGGNVNLRLFAESGQVVVEVEDTGPGIPEEEIGQIFDPFYRLSGSAGNGSGLGLSIVKGIADKYAFKISLRNIGNGEGLRFRVEMPPVRDGG